MKTIANTQMNHETTIQNCDGMTCTLKDYCSLLINISEPTELQLGVKILHITIITDFQLSMKKVLVLYIKHYAGLHLQRR